MKPQADFDPKIAAKKLMREGRSGALATLMPGSGDPYCSLVNVASCGRRLAADPDLAARDPHQEHPRRQPRCR